jgi:hypothetical protein
MLRSMLGSALRRSASIVAGKDVLALEQYSRCLQVHSVECFRGRAFGMPAWHQRMYSSETPGLGNERGPEQDKKFLGNVDPNIVSVTLLVDTLELMKKFEVQSLPDYMQS